MCCETCFHYEACSALDAEGHMFSKAPEFYDGYCEHYASKKMVKTIYPINCFYGKLGNCPRISLNLTKELLNSVYGKESTAFQKFIDDLIKKKMAELENGYIDTMTGP